jgi:hypothetical protein
MQSIRNSTLRSAFFRGEDMALTRLSYHAMTLILFTGNDFKTTILPMVCFSRHVPEKFYKLKSAPGCFCSWGGPAALRKEGVAYSPGVILDLATPPSIQPRKPDARLGGRQAQQTLAAITRRPHHTSKFPHFTLAEHHSFPPPVGMVQRLRSCSKFHIHRCCYIIP